MGRISAKLFMVGTLLFGAGCVFPGPAACKPDALIAVPYNFGDYPAGTVARFHMSIINRSQHAVLIKDVQTSCSCTSAKPAAWKVSPHGKDQLTIRIDGLSVGGAFRGTVLVVGHTAAASPVVWRIDLTGNFVAASDGLVAVPRSIRIGYPKPGEKIVQMVDLRRNGLPRIGPVTVTATVPWISVTKDHRRSTSSGIEYKVVIRPPAATGLFRQEIRFQGKNAADFLRIPVSGRTLPAVRVRPRKILLAPDQSTYDLSISTPAHTSITLRKYRTVNRGVQVTSVRQRDNPTGGKMMLQVRIRPIRAGFISAELLLWFKQWKEPVKVMFVGVGK